MTSQPETSVGADEAYVAARARAWRITEALILTEAQVLSLQKQLGGAQAENASLRRRLAHLEGDDPNDPVPGVSDGATD